MNIDAAPEDVGLSSERLARLYGWARQWVDAGKFVAACVVVTAILVPLATHWWASRVQRVPKALPVAEVPRDVGGPGDRTGLPVGRG